MRSLIGYFNGGQGQVGEVGRQDRSEVNGSWMAHTWPPPAPIVRLRRQINKEDPT